MSDIAATTDDADVQFDLTDLDEDALDALITRDRDRLRALADEAGLPVVVCELIWHFLSRVIGRHAGWRGAVSDHKYVLLELMTMSFERSGEKITAAHAELDPTCRTAKTGLLHLGLRPEHVDAMWDVASGLSEDRPLMPLDVALACFEVKWWRPAATMISWGPLETWARLKLLEKRWKRRPLQATRALTARTGYAPKTKLKRLTLARGLMTRLVTMRAAGIPSEGLLDVWDSVPPLDKDTRGRAAQKSAPTISDRSGPPLRPTRRGLKEAQRIVEDAHRTKYGRENMFRLLRRRAIFGLLVALGCREDALRELNVGDYKRAYAGWTDGAVRSALVIEPRKSLDWGEKRVKVLPAVPEAWLLEYLDYIGYAQIARNEDGTFKRPTGSDLLLSDWEITAPDHWPLLTTRFQRNADGGYIRDQLGRRIAVPERISKAALYAAIAGTKGTTKAGITYIQRPLIVHLNGHGPWHGYSPQTFRHAVVQLATRAAWDVRPNVPELAHWEPGDFARALVDHSFRCATTSAYGDKEARRDYAGALAALATWELLWSDAGAEMVPDLARQHEAKIAHQEATHNVERLRARRDEFFNRKDAISNRSADGLTGDDLVRFYGEQQREYRAADLQLQRLQPTLDEAIRAVAHAEAEVEAARQARAPLDDLVDIESLTDVEPLELPVTLDGDAPEYARGYLWLTEVAEGMDMSEPQMRRWATGRFERANVPWDKPAPGQPVCPPWEMVSHNRRRLWVIDDGTGHECLDPARVPPEILDRMLALLKTA